MSDMIFDAPWWLDLLLFAVGFYVFVSGNRRQNGGVRNLGLGIVGGGVLLILLAIFVDTPKKIARRETKTLVTSAVSSDWNAFQSVLAPKVKLQFGNASPVSSTAKDLTQIARANVDAVHLKVAHFRSIQVEQEGAMVRVDLHLTTEQEMAEAPLLDSSWQIEFGQVGSDWKITSISPTELGGVPAQDIQNAMRKR